MILEESIRNRVAIEWAKIEERDPDFKNIFVLIHDLLTRAITAELKLLEAQPYLPRPQNKCKICGRTAKNGHDVCGACCPAVRRKKWKPAK